MKLPPLAPLRAFEAAARHLSFTRAAGELHVTQGAVSQQVKQLEEYLGFALFHRRPRRLELTDEGRAFHEVVGSSLRQISDTAESLKSAHRAGPVTVSVLPSFAVKWLIPRLAKFREIHPDIPVRVDAEPRAVDLRGSEIDIAVRFTNKSYPELHAVELFRDRVFPVCSPDLVRDGRAPRRLEDLRDATLLYDTVAYGDLSGCDWDFWLKQVGLDGVDTHRGTGFTQADMVLQAAILGEGIALTRGSLAELDLAAGRLVKPLDISTPCPWTHLVVCLEEALSRPNVRAFHDWLIDEGTKVKPIYEKS
ncbi:MAG: transcriptional regulator GcvA [Arenicellales bacterium]